MLVKFVHNKNLELLELNINKELVNLSNKVIDVQVINAQQLWVAMIKYKPDSNTRRTILNEQAK